VPEGVVYARIDSDPAAPPDARGGSDYFYREFAPVKDEPASPPAVARPLN